MFSDGFKKDLAAVDDLINEVTDLFNEREISPFVAVAVTDHLKMVAQGGLDQWLEIHRQSAASGDGFTGFDFSHTPEEKKEPKETKEEE